LNFTTLAFSSVWCSGQKGLLHLQCILVIDITGKSHSFTFAPYATVFNLRSQVNSKFNITSDLYRLSTSGKPLHDCVIKRNIWGCNYE